MGLHFSIVYVMTENPRTSRLTPIGMHVDLSWIRTTAVENEKSKEQFLELDKTKDWRGMATLLSEGTAQLPKELRAQSFLLAAFLFAKVQEREQCLKQLENGDPCGMEL